MKEFHPDDKSENLENAQLNRISILVKIEINFLANF